MAKPMHIGHAARSGVLAARLAQAGFTANDRDVFEHEQGFLDVFNGPGTYDVQRALDAWAAPLDIVRPGIAIKQYPCCGSTHPAIDAMLDIVERRDSIPTTSSASTRGSTRGACKHTNRPRSAEPARRQVQPAVRAGARAGRSRASASTISTASASARRACRRCCRASTSRRTTTAQFAADNHFGGAVQVTLRDGTVETARVEQALGRTSDNPVPPERLRRKFELCAATVLRDDAIAPIAAADR